MINSLYKVSLLFFMLFMSACSTKIQQLSPSQEKAIYHKVVKEVNTEILKADKLLYNNYLHLAIISYQKAAYYNTDVKIDLRKKIDCVEKLQERKRIYYYELGKETLNENPKISLQTLNTLIRIDPYYKDSKALYIRSKELPQNKNFLHNKEKLIQNYFIQDTLKSESKLATLIVDLNELFTYDDSSIIGLKYSELVNIKKRNYLSKIEQKAIIHYEQDAITKAKEDFVFLLKLDPSNINAKKYIAIINEEKKMIEYVNISKRKLQANKYAEAKYFVKKALEVNDEYKKAKDLLIKINGIATKEIPLHINKGKALYKQKRFTQALVEFEKVLVFEPENNISITLVTKIQNRLKTIDSLTH